MFGVLESNRRTFDPDTTRPILPGPIPGRADFVLAHHLVVVRRWMWMLQMHNLEILAILCRCPSLTRCGGKDLLVIRSDSFGFVDEEACTCSRSWAMDDMDEIQNGP
jgi:hypothetical protein